MCLETGERRLQAKPRNRQETMRGSSRWIDSARKTRCAVSKSHTHM
jgi:hypothetical protein